MRIMQHLRSSLLRSEIKEVIPSPLRRGARVFLLAVVFVPFLLSAVSTAFAGSATWNLNPTSGDWFTASNWTPATVPNGPNDTATFDVSNVTDVFVSANTELAGIVFNAGANAFTITVSPSGGSTSLTMDTVGITNNSVMIQSFVAAGAVDGTAFNGQILFTHAATAGSLTAFTTKGGMASGGLGGAIVFESPSSAGNGTFTNDGAAVSGAKGGSTIFTGNSDAGSATLIANGGSSEGAGGSIQFSGDSRTLHAGEVKVFGNGNLDISGAIRGVMVASIEGSGNIFLGGNMLTVGQADSGITFSGVIQDGGLQGGTGGSLRIRHTAVVLTNANTYTGGTVIAGDGKLLVNNRLGSGTGSGPVGFQPPHRCTLGGTGTIAGAVAIPGNTFIYGLYFLSPGSRRPDGGEVGPGTLTIQSTLTFDGFPGNGNVIYQFELNSRTGRADKVVANGVTISGAQISFSGLGGEPLTLGTVFTVIDNRAATPIAGTFENLPDGSIFSANRNNFQASYEGGDGNDLTLTVVP